MGTVPHQDHLDFEVADLQRFFSFSSLLLMFLLFACFALFRFSVFSLFFGPVRRTLLIPLSCLGFLDRYLFWLFHSLFLFVSFLLLLFPFVPLSLCFRCYCACLLFFFFTFLPHALVPIISFSLLAFYHGSPPSFPSCSFLLLVALLRLFPLYFPSRNTWTSFFVDVSQPRETCLA